MIDLKTGIDTELLAEAQKLKALLVARLDYFLRYNNWEQVIRVIENWHEELQSDPLRQYELARTMLQKANQIAPDRIKLWQELLQVVSLLEEQHCCQHCWQMLGILTMTEIFSF